MVGRHHRLNEHEIEQILGDSKGQGSLACCSLWGHKESYMTQSLNNNIEYFLFSGIVLKASTHSLIKHQLTSRYQAFLKVQFSSVTQLCLTFCDPTAYSTPGLPVYHQLPEPTQTHVHGVGDAMQPSHPLSSPSPPAFNLSQHQGLLK